MSLMALLSGYRVTGNAVALGQAAGALAALSAKTGRLPRNVPWPDVSEALGLLNEKGDLLRRL